MSEWTVLEITATTKISNHVSLKKAVQTVLKNADFTYSETTTINGSLMQYDIHLSIEIDGVYAINKITELQQLFNDITERSRIVISHLVL